MKRLFVLLGLALLLIGAGVQAQGLDESQALPAMRQQLQRMREDITKQKLSFQVGYNSAMTRTIAQLCGAKPPMEWWKTARDKNLTKLAPARLKAAVSLPASWDWRDHNGVTAIRDQGNCGSCWAFGSAGGFECFLLARNGVTADLSEQYLVSCNSLGYGCGGGWWAFDMLISPGAVLESLFPYVASDVPCPSGLTYAYQASGWAYVDGDNQIANTQKIKEAIYQIGPVVAAVYVGPYFQAYTGGVFDKEEAKGGGFSCSADKSVNHAILLVGWDDAAGAWILRNSWGTGWGEAGYMRIKYGISKVGFAAASVY
ncbi:MAG TPA: C1 family peptidase [bacterium]|nr:C1 family peptidase [bacterium]